MSKYNKVPIKLLVEICIGEHVVGEKYFASSLDSIKGDLLKEKQTLEQLRDAEAQKEYMQSHLNLRKDSIHLNLVSIKVNEVLMKSTEEVFRLAQMMIFDI